MVDGGPDVLEERDYASARAGSQGQLLPNLHRRFHGGNGGREQEREKILEREREKKNKDFREREREMNECAFACYEVCDVRFLYYMSIQSVTHSTYNIINNNAISNYHKVF